MENKYSLKQFDSLFYSRRDTFDTSSEYYLQVLNSNDTQLMCRLSAFYYRLPNDDFSFSNEERCLKLLEKASDLKDIYAMEKLGDFNRYGTGYIAKHPSLAMNLYSEASEMGNFSCMLKVASMYEDEYMDENENYKQSFWWIQKAIDARYPHAFYVMGQHYSDGIGVKQNWERAEELYIDGARLGDEECMGITGIGLDDGKDV